MRPALIRETTNETKWKKWKDEAVEKREGKNRSARERWPKDDGDDVEDDVSMADITGFDPENETKIKSIRR